MPRRPSSSSSSSSSSPPTRRGRAAAAPRASAGAAATALLPASRVSAASRQAPEPAVLEEPIVEEDGELAGIGDPSEPIELEPGDLESAVLDDSDALALDAHEDVHRRSARARPADDDDALVLDVGSAPLVRRRAVPLPEGEWVRGEGPEPVADEEAVPLSRGDDLYNAFVRQATRLQRLSEEEERAFGLRVRDHQDQAAARKLVVHNLRLAIKMAHQHRRSWTNLMDLVQEASAGMAIAAQRWDPDQGTRFGTYAVYWIRAQLTKFLMTNGRAIHTGNTRAGRKLYFQLPRVRRKLLAEGREASIANIAAEVQEDEAEVARVVARLDAREASLDAPMGADDDSGTLGDLLAHDEASPEQNAARLEVQGVITHLMTRFALTLDNERDRAIWTEHLVAAEPASLVELGARYGVSKQRMGQLATRIKRAFRRHIIDELGPSTQLHWLFGQD